MLGPKNKEKMKRNSKEIRSLSARYQEMRWKNAGLHEEYLEFKYYLEDKES